MRRCSRKSSAVTPPLTGEIPSDGHFRRFWMSSTKSSRWKNPTCCAPPRSCRIETLFPPGTQSTSLSWSTTGFNRSSALTPISTAGQVWNGSTASPRSCRIETLFPPGTQSTSLSWSTTGFNRSSALTPISTAGQVCNGSTASERNTGEARRWLLRRQVAPRGQNVIWVEASFEGAQHAVIARARLQAGRRLAGHAVAVKTGGGQAAQQFAVAGRRLLILTGDVTIVGDGDYARQTALRDHRQGDSRFEAVAEHDFARQRHQFFRLRGTGLWHHH